MRPFFVSLCLCGSFANQAVEIFFVLADRFHEFVVWKQFKRERDLPGLRVRLRIIDGDFVRHMAKVKAMKAFGRMIALGMRMAAIIYICQVIETDRIDHERIALPLADRISHPRGRRVLRESAAIRENLAEVALVLEMNQRHGGSLNDLERSCRDKKRIWHPVRQAASRRPVLTEVFLPL